MIFSDASYAGITFSRFIRGSGYMIQSVEAAHQQIGSTKDANTGTDGVQQYFDFYRLRIVTVRGVVKGSSESDLYQKISALEKALDIHRLEALGNYGFQPWTWTDPGLGQAIFYLKPTTMGARFPALAISEQRTGLARNFSMFLEAKDPTKYLNNPITYTITPGTSGGSGSAFANVFPMVFAGSSFVGTLVVPNSGSSTVLPSAITFNGPSTGSWQAPLLTNQTTGVYIGFSSAVVLSPGDVLVVNPSLGTALYTPSGSSTTQDMSAYLTAGSDLSLDIAPGNNTLQISGSVLSATSSLTIVINSSF